jgi:hypothetical protein
MQHNKKFKLLDDVLIVATGEQTYIVSTMPQHKENCYLVAGKGKPFQENQLIKDNEANNKKQK